MPWSVDDVERHMKGLSPRQKRVWVRVANAALSKCLADGRSQASCEGSAIRQANSVAGKMPKAYALHQLAIHAAGGPVRYETFDGRQYAITTVVPIREGVLNSYYVPAAEIAAFAQSWNGLVCIDHPKNSYGEYVSVHSPLHLEQTIGRLFNAQWDGERLTGEVWVDVEKCERLGSDALDVLERIEAGEALECSTAFWAETDPSPGTWQGTDYLGIHRALRPDHLAILPRTTGACSLEDGCGLRALAADCACHGDCHCDKGESMDLTTEEKSPGKLRQALRTLFAFANDDAPEPPRPPPDPDPDDDDEPPPDEDEPARASLAAVEPALQSQEQAIPQEKGRYTMLTKQELVGRLIAHEHASWTTEQAPVLLTLEERVLEQMLHELERRQQEAPLTLKALQNELNTRDKLLKDEYDKKLATHVQALEERQERDQLQAFFEQRGRTPEELATMPLTTLRWMHQELSPMSYVSNGLPRASGSAYDDNLPDDNPATE